jgi:Pyruvate/2-oxoacid:ferredoxin oxidoreductase gamma subunit
VERELMMSGIGGQGIQLAAQVLARAAVAEGREVLLFGSYGGMMRGGNTEATIVVADRPIESPPTVSSTWSAIVMHHEHWEIVSRRLRPGSLVLLNSSVFDREVDWSPYRLVEVEATALAAASGGMQTATMVMLGAYVGLTGLVGPASLESALTISLPSYRSQHVERNVAAIEAGVAAVPRLAYPAWSDDLADAATGARG